MTESKEWQGTWFIEMPDGSKITFRGILSYDPSNGCTLKASTDEHSDQFLNFIHELNKIEIIFGYENIHHKGILLRKCIITNALQGIETSINVTVSEVIGNINYQDQTSLQFDKSRIEFTILESWLDNKNVKIKTHHEEDPTIKFSFTYKQPEALIFNINEYIDIKFVHSYSVSTGEKSSNMNIFNGRCDCYIVSKKGKISSVELDEYTEHFRRLLAIFYHQYCFTISHSRLITEEYISYDKYYKQRGFDRTVNYPKYGNILVKYEEIKDIALSVFQTWFGYRRSSDLSYAVYIASKSISSFSEEVFLENSRALEVYHKTKIKKMHFKDRLKDLVRRLKEISEEIHFNGFISDTDRFVDLVSKNRNYLTHYGDDTISKEDELEMEELLRLTRRCKIILIMCILDDLKLDSKRYFSKLVNTYDKLI